MKDEGKRMKADGCRKDEWRMRKDGEWRKDVERMKATSGSFILHPSAFVRLGSRAASGHHQDNCVTRWSGIKCSDNHGHAFAHADIGVQSGLLVGD
jgi:hypothetical protein